MSAINRERDEYLSRVTAYYMRSNHTFRALPLDVEAALVVMRDERDAGQTYGMLCGRPRGVVPGPVHASSAAEWPDFEDAARPWLETVVARSKPPNAPLIGGDSPPHRADGYLAGTNEGEK